MTTPATPLPHYRDRLRAQDALRDALHTASSPTVARRAYDASPLEPRLKDDVAVHHLPLQYIDDAWAAHFVRSGRLSALTARGVMFEPQGAAIARQLTALLGDPTHPAAASVITGFLHQAGRPRRPDWFPDPRALIAFGLGRLARRQDWSTESEDWLRLFDALPECTDDDLMAAVDALATSGHRPTSEELRRVAQHTRCTGRVAAHLHEVVREAEQQEPRRDAVWGSRFSALPGLTTILLEQPSVWASDSLPDFYKTGSIRYWAPQHLATVAATRPACWLAALRGATRTVPAWTPAFLDELAAANEQAVIAAGLAPEDLTAVLTHGSSATRLRALDLITRLPATTPDHARDPSEAHASTAAPDNTATRRPRR